MWKTADPVVREWIERNLGPIGKLEGAVEGAGEIGRFVAQVPSLLTRGAELIDQLDTITRDGLVLAPETVEAIGAAETRRNRGLVFGIWAIVILLVILAIYII
jgi:ubiquinone biosynthesis protein